MKQLGLVVKQRKQYRVTSKNKATADNLLNQNFNPVVANEIWAGDITYLKTPEGWLYLGFIFSAYCGLAHVIQNKYCLDKQSVNDGL